MADLLPVWHHQQGGFFMALDPAAFMPREEFAAQMAQFVDEAGTMEPFPGQTHADLPGGLEARTTAEYLKAVRSNAAQRSRLARAQFTDTTFIAVRAYRAFRSQRHTTARSKWSAIRSSYLSLRLFIAWKMRR